MVGVPKSTGCLACRKSKVKCDEVKPTCRRCQRTGRTCAYADKFTFVNETQKQAVSDEQGESMWPLVVLPKRGEILYTSQKLMKNGGVVQKWRRSLPYQPLAHKPSMTGTDIQASQLIRCWQEGPVGMRFDLTALWFKDLPARLGKSGALDDAAHLVSSVHGRMIRDPDPANWMCLASYNKAIRSLQKAVVDPEQGYWVETITAACILHTIEDKFGSYSAWNTLHHAGGVSRLLQVRGPANLPKDEFEWQISHSVTTGTSYFLSDPEWVAFFDAWEPMNERDAFVQELFQQYIQWPLLAYNVRKLCKGLLSTIELEETRNRIKKIRSRLNALETVLDEYMADETVATLVPSVQADSLFDEVYHVNEPFTVALVGLHCSYIFVLDIMSNFIDTHGSLPTYRSAKRQNREFVQHGRLVEKVCRCIEYTAERQPLLSGLSTFWLQSAYPFAQTDGARDWILGALNEAEGYRRLETPRYRPEVIELVNRLMIGAIDIPRPG